MTGGGPSGTVKVFLLPDLGEGLTEAEIVSWSVSVGERVEVDQIIAVVETAKAAVDLPCPYAGTVLALHGEPGDVLAVGAPFISVDVSDGHESDARRNPPEAGSEAGPEDPHAGPEDPHTGPEDPHTGPEDPHTGPEDPHTGPEDPHTGPEDPHTGPDAGSGNVLIGYGTSAAPARRRRTCDAPATGAPTAPPTDSAPGPAAADGGAVSSRPGGRVRVISPLVRRIAAEHGIDMRALRPSGPKGIIVRADVEAAIAQRAASPGDRPERLPSAPSAPAPTSHDAPSSYRKPATRPVSPAHPAPAAHSASAHPRPAAPADVIVPMTLAQRTMAERLATSRREVPDATTWVDVDATGLLELRAELTAGMPQARIGVLALVGRIVVAGLRRFPELNARADLTTGTLTRFGQVHLSFAAQGPRGLVVPVVHDAGSMTTAELAAALRDLTDRARAGTSTPAELAGGTFTVNNYGGYGVDGSTPIINHPEAGMLGIGRIIDKPWVVDGRLAVRTVTQLSLTFDHRVCDGAVAGGFLRFVADCVERPALLVGAL